MTEMEVYAPQMSEIEQAHEMSEWLPDFIYGVTDTIEELPEVMVGRVQEIFGQDIDHTQAMLKIREAAGVFSDDPDDEHNFALFISGYPTETIHQLGIGDTITSLHRIHERLRPVAPEQAPDKEPDYRVAKPIGKKATSLSVRVNEKNQRPSNLQSLNMPATVPRQVSTALVQRLDPKANLLNREPMSVGMFDLDKEDNDWQEKALCAQTDPEAFFPEKGGSTREAKRICLSCEVKDKCLDTALDNDERFGIWGGLSERERRRLKRGIAY